MTKNEIEKMFDNDEWQDSEEQTTAILNAINEYESKNPDDLDIYSLKMAYYIGKNDYESAITLGREGINKNRYILDIRFNYAYALELAGYMVEAYIQYNILNEMQSILESYVVDKDNLQYIIKNIENILTNNVVTKADIIILDTLLILKTFRFTVRENYFNFLKLVGSRIADLDMNKYYVGYYNNWYNSVFNIENCRSSVETTLEIYPIEAEGNSYEAEFGVTTLLPIVPLPNESMAGTIPRNEIKVQLEGEDKEIVLNATEYLKYSYYRIPKGKCRIISDAPMVIGRPLPLYSNNRKLVLNLFIDSFNWRFFDSIDGKDGRTLENIMPNTYNFFKKGTICTNAFCGGEWTFPSISTYMTGVHTNKHMMVNGDVHLPLSDNLTTVPEYFKANGYVTSKLGGNDRVALNYGELKGIDRCCYKSYMYAYEVVNEIIENIKTFKETKQFIWAEFLELHQIAGHFERSISIQSQTDIGNRELDNDATNTVRATFSENSQVAYEKELSRLDYYFGCIYDFIINNYEENEFEVCLFSDHGTAFNVQNSKPMLCRERTNIPFMIRGNDIPVGICDEFIETCDYKAIICETSGIRDYDIGEGNLPSYFGGSHRRDFVFTESIFMNDPYVCAIHSDKCSLYIETVEPVRKDGRFKINKFNTACTDENDEEIKDEEFTENGIRYVMEQIKNCIIY